MHPLYTENICPVNNKPYADLWREMVEWHKTSRGILYNVALTDIAGSVPGGILLSQIVYWHAGKGEDETRLTLRDNKEKLLWLLKTYKEWWEETRLTEHQVRSALNDLENRKLIMCRIIRHNDSPCRALRLMPSQLYTEWKRVTTTVQKPKKRPERSHERWDLRDC